MDLFDFIVITKNDSYELLVHKTQNYMLITYLGIWNEKSYLDDYLEDIQQALIKLTKGFSILIDLRQYRGSTSEYIHLHIEGQNMALRAGLSRTAVVIHDNPLLKVTVEYIFSKSGIRAAFFSNIHSAISYISLEPDNSGL